MQLLMSELKFLAGYPASLQQQVKEMLSRDQLGPWLRQRYQGQSDTIKSDKALYQYTMALKNQYLKSSPPISKVVFDSKINVIQHALGLHTAISRVQGGKLKAKAEIQIAALFKEAPAPFCR